MREALKKRHLEMTGHCSATFRLVTKKCSLGRLYMHAIIPLLER